MRKNLSYVFKYAVLVWAVLLIHSCSVTNKRASAQPAEDRLLFASVNVKKEENGKLSFELLNRVWSDASIKDRQETATSNGFLCEFLDSKKVAISSCRVENPLSRVMESYSEDGTISKQKVELDEGILVIRYMVPENVKYLRISLNESDFSNLMSLQ